MAQIEKKILTRLWRHALPLLRKGRRYDLAHTRDIIPVAYRVARAEKISPLLLVSAAMLHDIGWAFVPKRHVRSYHSRHARLLHMRRGAAAAGSILRELGYPATLRERIVHLVAVHDLPSAGVGRPLKGRYEGLLRDIDFSWRFMRGGFRKDMIEHGSPDPIAFLNSLIEKAHSEGRFRSRSTSRIATALIRERQREVERK